VRPNIVAKIIIIFSFVVFERRFVLRVVLYLGVQRNVLLWWGESDLLDRFGLSMGFIVFGRALILEVLRLVGYAAAAREGGSVDVGREVVAG